MPRIPDLREQGHLAASNPTPIGGPNAGALLGEAVESAGEGLQRVAGIIAERNRATKAAQRALDQDTARQAYERIAQEEANRALRTGNGDEPEIFDKAFRERADKEVSLDGFDAPTTQGIKNQLADIANNYRQPLFVASLDRQKKSVDAQLETNKQRASALVRANPDAFDTEALGRVKTLQGLAGTAFPEHELPEKQRKDLEELGMESVRGHIERHNYADATNQLNKLSKYISEEKRAALSYEIIDREQKKISSDNLAYTRAENMAKTELTKKQDKAFDDVKSTVFSATDPKSREGAMLTIEALNSQNLLREPQYKFLKDVVNDNYEREDDDRAVNLMLDAYGTRDQKELGRLKNLTMAYWAGRHIKKDTALKVLSQIAQQSKDKKEVSDSWLRSRGADYINKKLGWDPMTGKFMNEELKSYAGSIGMEWARDVEAGKNPLDSAESIIRKYEAPSKSMPVVKGVPTEYQNDPKSIDQYAKGLIERMLSLATSPAEKRRLKVQLDGLEKRKQVLQREQLYQPKRN